MFAIQLAEKSAHCRYGKYIIFKILSSRPNAIIPIVNFIVYPTVISSVTVTLISPIVSLERHDTMTLILIWSRIKENITPCDIMSKKRHTVKINVDTNK